MIAISRSLLVKAHRYLGLTLLCFLVVISFTGFALAFEREWDALLNPGLYAASGQPYALAYDEVFVDPTSGAVNGLRQWGECCSRANILPLLYKVHNRLLLPQSTGRPLLAGIALSWLVLSAAGCWWQSLAGCLR